MTRKEFWLKLFAENDTALASALILVDRFVTEEQLQRGKEYIESRKKELYEEMPLNEIQSVFPNYHPTKKGGMRDRLIELIAKVQYMGGLEGKLADHILADGWIRPPCKVGDMVYRVVTMGTGVTFKKVGYNTYREKEQAIKHFIRCVTVTKNNFFDVLENFGKTVFLTREQAEAKLKEGKG